MASFARALLISLMWHQPEELLFAATLLGVTGVALSVWVASLFNRRLRPRQLAMESAWLSLAFIAFCLVDWGLLRALPILGLSFAPEIRPPLLVSLLIRLLTFWGLLGVALLSRWCGGRRGVQADTRPAAFLFLAVNLAFSAVQVDAYVVEPLWLKRTQLQITSGALDPSAPPVRIVHLTDLHIERSSYRERRVVRAVNALRPDVIVLTGDYLNLSYLSDETSVAHFRQLVEQLEAPHGIYAVRGSVEPTLESMERLVAGTPMTWLEQEAVTLDVRGQRLTLVGVACSHRHAQDAERLAQAMEDVPPDTFTLLLYHSPDLIEEAAAQEIDLYLAGHTHGGQLRLPFYGAIVTASRYGKRYARGRFEFGRTTLYVSQGLGFEGGGMPRARFLCRPEIVRLDLTGK
jgi:predicted MPP superfamily phosphohydrolase